MKLSSFKSRLGESTYLLMPNAQNVLIYMLHNRKMFIFVVVKIKGTILIEANT